MSLSRSRRPRYWHFCLMAFGFGLLAASEHLALPVLAQDAAPDEGQVRLQASIEPPLADLEKNPRRGTALDRVYGYHVENGTLDELMRHYHDRTARNPQDRVAWTILGLIEAQRGRDALAVQAFTKADSAPNPDALIAYYRGQSLVLMGQPDEAVKAFEEAISRRPAPADLVEIVYSLGRVHQAAQHTEQALDVWKRLETLFPKDTQIQEQIAGILAEEGQDAFLLSCHERLIQLTKDGPRKIAFQIEAAELKVKLNRAQEGIADLEKVLDTLKPADRLHREIRSRIEDLFLKANDQEGLAKYYQNRLARRTDDIDSMSRLSRILSKQGRIADAQMWIDKALKLAPGRQDIRQAFVDQLVDHQRFADALVQYELLDQAAPNNPDILRAWGKVILRDLTVSEEGRFKRVEKLWRRLSDAHPNDPAVATQVADLFRHSEMPDAALELYEKAVTLAPDQRQHLEHLGAYYHALQRPSEALSTWRKIADGKWRTAVNLVRLAELLSASGYWKEALLEIDAACELDQTDLELQLKAADLLTTAKQYSGALAALDKAEKLARNLDESELVLSARLKVFELENSLTSHTLKLIEVSRQMHPSAEQWSFLARLHAAQGQYSEASLAVERALKLDPQSIPKLILAARIHQEAGNLESAIAVNRRLVVLDQQSRGDYLKRIADLESQSGRADEALKAGRELINAASGKTDHHEFYADLCFRLGRSDEGLQTLRQAVRNNPEPKLLAALAEAFAKQDRTDEAIELYWIAFDKSASLDEKLAQIDKLASLYLRTNDSDRLLERMRRLHHEATDKRETSICLVRVYSTRGEWRKGRRVLERLLNDSPRDTRLLAQLSTFASSENDLNGAIDYQRQLVELAPGPQSEYPLATLLARTGAVEESVAITWRLMSQETDPERFLNGLDSLIRAGQQEAARLLIDSKLREHPKDWELLYREGALLASNDPESAAIRFRAFLELPHKLDTPGIVQKSRSANGAKPAPATMERFNSVYFVRSQIVQGAQTRDLRGTRFPPEYGQARIAALGWLLRFARDSNREGEFIAGFQQAAEDPKTTTTALWDAANVIALSRPSGYVTSLPESLPFIKKLAAMGELDGQYAYLWSLQSRVVVAHSQPDGTTSAEIGLVPPEEFPLMVSSYRNLQKHKRTNEAAGNYYAYTALVTSELMRAGLSAETDELYRSVVGELHEVDEFAQAIVFTVSRQDVPGTLAVYGKWFNLARKDHPKNAYIETPLVKLMGVLGARRQDAQCLQLLDGYLDQHQVWANSGRRKQVDRPTRAPLPNPESIRYYFGEHEFNDERRYLARASHYDSFAISVLRTAFEVFHRSGKLTELQQHLAQRLKKSVEGDKVYGHLALAYIYGWNDDKLMALSETQKASSLVDGDWRIKLDIARLYLDLKNFADALRIAESIIPVDPDSIRERETLVLTIAYHADNPERAKLAAHRLLGLRLDVATQMSLVRQLQLLGMKEQADAMLIRVRQQAAAHNMR